MAKPLAARPPSSAIARLFDLDAAARAASGPLQRSSAAIFPPAHRREDPSVSLPVSPGPEAPTGEPAIIKRELVLTPSADATLTQLVSVFRDATGTKLTTSHVARAMLQVVAICLPHIQRHATAMSHVPLPSNAKGREADRDRFEQRIADAFQAGITAASISDPA